MAHKKTTALCLAIAVLSGCSSSGHIPGDSGSDNRAAPGSRYSLKKDVAPERDIDVSMIPNAVPRAEPYSARGNKTPYVVWGKTYHVLDSHEGYSETGLASWYGQKFHGHETSNGEIYDMYKMTAAHKSLPIPSYVLVENLDNGAEVIVRVNDRGPFHSDRIIDLSYAAAKKLGYKDKGTAKVRVTGIPVSGNLSTPAPQPESSGMNSRPEITSTPLPPQSAGQYFVQVGAFSEQERAQAFRASISDRISGDTRVHSEGLGLLARHKVWAGPFESREVAEGQLENIKRAGFFGAFIATP